MLATSALTLVLLVQTAAATPPPVKAADPGDRVVCVTDESTGSILPHRTCHKQREWKQIKADEAAVQHATSAGALLRPQGAGR